MERSIEVRLAVGEDYQETFEEDEAMTTTAIKEKPIIFTCESVRAVLAGRKTQTRRVIKPQPHAFALGKPIIYDKPCHTKEVTSPYWPELRLWVKEYHAVNGDEIMYQDDEDFEDCIQPATCLAKDDVDRRSVGTSFAFRLRHSGQEVSENVEQLED